MLRSAASTEFCRWMSTSQAARPVPRRFSTACLWRWVCERHIDHALSRELSAQGLQGPGLPSLRASHADRDCRSLARRRSRGRGALTHLQVEAANLSQHLSVLRAKQIVVSRKAGNQAYYTLRDPVVIQVLVLLKQYFNAQFHETVAMLDEVRATEDHRR